MGPLISGIWLNIALATFSQISKLKQVSNFAIEFINAEHLQNCNILEASLWQARDHELILVQ